MKNNIFKTTLLASGVSVVMCGAAVAEDKVYHAPRFAWVRVLNQEPVHGGNSKFSYGDACSIDKDGTLTIVGRIEAIDGEKLVVRYHLSGMANGAPCPDGIMFLATMEDLEAWDYDGKEAIAEEIEIRKKIREIEAGLK